MTRGALLGARRRRGLVVAALIALAWAARANARDDAADPKAVQDARARVRTTSVLALAPEVEKTCLAVTTPGCKACGDLPVVLVEPASYRRLAALRTGGVPEGNVAMFVPAQRASSLPLLWRIFMRAARVEPPFVLLSSDVKDGALRRLVLAHEFGHYLVRRHRLQASPVIRAPYLTRVPLFNDAFARHALDDERRARTVVWEGCGERNLRESIDRWKAVYGSVEEEFAILMEAEIDRLGAPRADFDDFFCARFDGTGSRATLAEAGYRLGPCPDGYALALQRYFEKIWERAGAAPAAGARD